MSLRTVELPSPRELYPRWTTMAAMLTALGRESRCFADGARWHFNDAGGNWAELHQLPEGSVLIGHDHEYSETYFREAAAYFGEEETDLLAGAPDWWVQPLAGRDPQDWVGFVYGFDGQRWQRADYDLDDGAFSVIEWLRTDDATTEAIAGYVSPRLAKAGAARDGLAEARALVAADGDVSADLIRALFAPVEVDVDAAVAAARRFSPP